MAKPRFGAGALSTNFIAEEFPGGFASPAGFVAPDRVILLAAALAHRRIREHEAAIDGQLAGGRAEIAEHLIVLLDGRSYPVSVRPEDGTYRVEIEGEKLPRGDRLAAGGNFCCRSVTAGIARPCRSTACRERHSGWCMAA